MAETTLRVDRIPLSHQQEFLSMVDHGDDSGPFGPRYTIVGGWRIFGDICLDTLQAALDDVVVRHESLRTVIVRDNGDPYQSVLPPSSPVLEVRDLVVPEGSEREIVAEELLNEIEAGEFAIQSTPLIRALVGRFDPDDSMLVLVAHHTACDGWSIHRLMRDIAVIYAARREGTEPVLPEARQYREYVQWQRDNEDGPAMAAARAYWREQLGDAQVVPIKTDIQRADGDFTTAWHRFLLTPDLTAAVEFLAAETRSSPYMVLLAAYLVYLRDTTGQTDLVVPTFTPGRNPSWAEDTVGSFYNFVPLRTDITGCEDLREVISRVRTTCLNAYANEIPFSQLLEEVPDVMSAALEANAACCVFQVTQSPYMLQGQPIGDLLFTAIRQRLVSAPVGSQIPDGALFGLEFDAEGAINGSIGYTSNLFESKTIEEMVAGFQNVLVETLATA